MGIPQIVVQRREWRALEWGPVRMLVLAVQRRLSPPRLGLRQSEAKGATAAGWPPATKLQALMKTRMSLEQRMFGHAQLEALVPCQTVQHLLLPCRCLQKLRRFHL